MDRKAVLVMDMPETCNDCYAIHYGNNGKFCRAAHDFIKPKQKPDWCPLRQMPEKFKQSDNQSYQKGWNDCIDEIGGGI